MSDTWIPYDEGGDVRTFIGGGFAESDQGVVFVYLLLGVAVSLHAGPHEAFKPDLLVGFNHDEEVYREQFSVRLVIEDLQMMVVCVGSNIPPNHDCCHIAKLPLLPSWW